jgi:lipid II:glycine glycyltransferase (peptidoglycan interpeptide bridge formation enzyme)
MLQELDQIAQRDHVTTIEAQLPPLAPAAMDAQRVLCNPLWLLGFADTSAATWISRNGGCDEQELWKGLEGRARTAARKAMSSGMSIFEGTEPRWAEIYFDLHRTTTAREALAGMPLEFFHAIWSGLVQHGLAKPYFAMHDGTPIAAVIIFVWKRGASYNSGASTARAHELEANSLLLWHALKESTAAGNLYFDFGEAAALTETGKPRNLSEFKRSFGGALHPLWRGRRSGKRPLLSRLAAVRRALASPMAS